jgi:3-methylfumaryl-CoA hydratase
MLMLKMNHSDKDIQMKNFDAWIGKKEIYDDFSDTRPVAMMQALLNQTEKQLAELPYLYHWFYFLPIVNAEDLAEDGHPQKGGFLPPIPFPKRMWAGGRLQFLKPIVVKQNIRRESEIVKIELKHGKSGDMYFVTVKHSIFAEDELAIIEEQDIVYREVSNQIATKKPDSAKPVTAKPYSYNKQFPLDTVTLFRYSALTFNGHKIHYDRPYATQKEGYPGLVVHGPLLATLLLHTFTQEYPEQEVASFEFRALNPLFDFNEFFICGDVHTQDGELWIEKTDGQLTMQAKVRFK